MRFLSGDKHEKTRWKSVVAYQMSAQVRDKDIRFVENKKKEAEFSPSTGLLLLGVERVIGTFLAMAIYYKGPFFS